MFDPMEKALLQKAFDEYHKALDAALPSEETLHAITISEKLEKRMTRLLYHQKHFYYTLINTAAKRAACILAAVLLAAAVTTASVEGLREGFINFIIETFEKGSTIIFPKNETPSIDIQPITPKLPTYIPEGYELVADMSDEIEIYRIYEGQGTETISYRQQPKGSKETVNTEGVQYKKIFVSEAYEGIIFQNLGETYLVFNDGEYMYTVIGTVSEEDILRIAESIPCGGK